MNCRKRGVLTLVMLMTFLTGCRSEKNTDSEINFPGAAQEPSTAVAGSAAGQPNLVDDGGGDLKKASVVDGYLKNGDVVLAEKSIDLIGEGGSGEVLVVRHAQVAGESRLNTCEIMVVSNIGGVVSVVARNSAAVDCLYNEDNKTAGPLELNDSLAVSRGEFTFINDNIRGGSYSYTFKFSSEKREWFLAGARSVYKGDESTSGEVRMFEEVVTYPRNVAYRSMTSFDPEDITVELRKTRSEIE